jgi:hypothetical protein
LIHCRLTRSHLPFRIFGNGNRDCPSFSIRDIIWTNISEVCMSLAESTVTILTNTFQISTFCAVTQRSIISRAKLGGQTLTQLNQIIQQSHCTARIEQGSTKSHGNVTARTLALALALELALALALVLKLELARARARALALALALARSSALTWARALSPALTLARALKSHRTMQLRFRCCCGQNHNGFIARKANGLRAIVVAPTRALALKLPFALALARTPALALALALTPALLAEDPSWLWPWSKTPSQCLWLLRHRYGWDGRW